MTTIRKILIANRGEIARRIMRTCRKLGIDTVAVHSEADANMPFVREADEAVCIGPAPSAESYLRVDKVLDAAARTGADAIHPGYGFLAENAGFAAACKDAGVIFIGPTPDAIASMGSKKEAKRLVADAGVPVVPGYDGEDQDPTVLAAKAVEIGFPVLLKASAGGGGKGMKRVHQESELADAIASAKREGEASFGDGTLLVEKYIEQPRHVEIQILGDEHGNLVHLFERECSIQRRHQKVIEEAPSPALDAALREKMGADAVRCGGAIGYSNAGTVEFILDPDGSYYFLEVNTRLQVEHPVTEMITGLDLVEEQIRVAEGRPLRMTRESLDETGILGHAVEVRLYAEDSENDFLPQSGPVVDWHLPEDRHGGLRVDAGVESGDAVGIHYDPMLAKIITHGSDRLSAIRKMQRALRTLSVQGLTTNRDFLLRVLGHEAFQSGDLHTHFIDQYESTLILSEADRGSQPADHLVIAATLAGVAERERTAKVLPGLPTGFRTNAYRPQRVTYVLGADDTFDARYERLRYEGEGRYAFWLDGAESPESTEPSDPSQSEGADSAAPAPNQVELLSWQAPSLIARIDGVRRVYRVIRAGNATYVTCSAGSAKLVEADRFPDYASAVPAGGCIAPMPGKIVEVRVAEGDEVTGGQVLIVMEAMKMEHAVTAAEDGVVAALHVAAGDQVEADALLAVIDGDGE